MQPNLVQSNVVLTDYILEGRRTGGLLKSWPAKTKRPKPLRVGRQIQRSSHWSCGNPKMITLREMLSSKNYNIPKYRVIIYIDGFNLYFGIRSEAIKRGSKDEPDPKWYRYMWLDLHGMSTQMLNSQQELVGIRYFTAPITGSKGKQDRQNAYLDAIRTLPLVGVTFGRFEPDRKDCDRCGHPAYHPQEKKTDVNIATALICDALEDKYDTAIIVTGDSDLVPALEAVKSLKPQKRFIVAFPPNRYSKEMQDKSGIQPIRIWESMLRQNRLPELIKRDGLPDLIRPHKYSGLPGCTSPNKPVSKNKK